MNGPVSAAPAVQVLYVFFLLSLYSILYLLDSISSDDLIYGALVSLFCLIHPLLWP